MNRRQLIMSTAATALAATAVAYVSDPVLREAAAAEFAAAGGPYRWEE